MDDDRKKPLDPDRAGWRGEVGEDTQKIRKERGVVDPEREVGPATGDEVEGERGHHAGHVGLEPRRDGGDVHPGDRVGPVGLGHGLNLPPVA